MGFATNENTKIPNTVTCSELDMTVTDLYLISLDTANCSDTAMKPESHQVGGGMSRAAKKRAKKNQKKSPALENGNLHPVDSGLVEEKEPKRLKRNDALKDGESDHRVSNSAIIAHDLHGSNHSDDGDDGTTEKDDYTSSFDLDPSESYSLPNTSLTEILMIDPAHDDEKSKSIADLSANHRAACLLQAIIDPIPLDKFYKEYWEKKPLVIQAHSNRKRFTNLLSLKSIRQMTKERSFYFGRDLNVTRYQKDKNGVKRRMTLDKLPKPNTDEEESGVLVDHKELWLNYDKGCTIRLLCPHKHSDNIHALLSTLELELQCMVGANAYLTPPNASQGFAPHYDDIEAFCLQLEGSKRWKVYEPTFKLPRTSSHDFTTQDLEAKTPFMDVTLEEGDLLYMPRGWIHQACTLQDKNEHSLHLTISAMQQWAWVDLLDIVMPEALESAASNEASTSLREGLPRGFMDYMGAMYEEPNGENLPESMKKIAEEEETEEKKLRTMLQEKFRADAKKRIMEVAKTAFEMIDASCDQLAKRFMSDRQPFVLTKAEKNLTSKRDDDCEEAEIRPNTLCRLIRPGIARLVIEDDKAVVYHCGDNSREYHGNPLSPLEFEIDDGAAIEQLLTTVDPHWIFVNDLFHDTIEDKVAIAQSLYDEGILAIRNQSNIISKDSGNSP